MRKLSLAALGVVGILAVNAHANLLVNGGFEAGSFSSWSVSGAAQVCPDASPYCGLPYEGNYSVSLNAGDVAPSAVLDQTFTTQPGVSYSVSFAYGLVDYAGGASQQLQVGVISQAGGPHDLLNQTVTSPPSNAFSNNVNYQLFTFGFVADDNSATLQFTDVATNQTVSVDGKLDAVSVTSVVPEPGNLLLLASGLIPFALRWTARRSRRH